MLFSSTGLLTMGGTGKVPLPHPFNRATEARLQSITALRMNNFLFAIETLSKFVKINFMSFPFSRNSFVGFYPTLFVGATTFANKLVR
jgi:hypothetical protein